jgi:dihydropyrimidinase
MYELVIKNGTVVTSTQVYRADVAVSGQHIVAVGLGLRGERELDATGKLVTPGAVDVHVHLSLDLGDGLVSSDDFFTGTRAAAYGGTTSVITFVHPTPEQSMMQAFEARKAEAGTNAVIDYGFHMAITPHHIGRLSNLQDFVAAGITSFKLYMAYALRLHDGQLLDALRLIKQVSGLPVVHAENWDAIQANIRREREAGNIDKPIYHEVTRPADLEAGAVRRSIEFAAYTSNPLLIFHIGNGQSAEAIARAQANNQRVYGETCPQYLLRSKLDYKREGLEGLLGICAPPLRTASDQRLLWGYLRRDVMNIVSTDHCPFTREQKARGLQDFTKTPGGVPSIEMRFAAMYAHAVRSDKLSLSRWVAVCCTRPAQLLGMTRKGHIAPGFDADLVIFDPEQPFRLSVDRLHENVDWTPYEGMTGQGWPQTVISRGQIIVQDGKFVGERGRGAYIHRETPPP